MQYFHRKPFDEVVKFPHRGPGTVEAHAKINWTLEVLGVRPDGYHDLRSVVLPVPLHDVVTLEEADGVVCEMPGLDVAQESNLAYRAALALKAATGCVRGVRIGIEKRIPAGAGLGGGSADAAAVLNGLNGLWALHLPEAEICEIAAQVGSDVPALTLNSPVLMEGRGERVRRLRHDECADLPKPEEIVVFAPGIFVSTPAVYRAFREEDRGLGPNDLQPAAIRLYPDIEGALHRLERQGLKRVTMSGSGSAVYGVKRPL